MKRWAWLYFAACGIGLLLSGCGSGSPALVAPAVSPLAGNWLIVGPMPTNEFSFPAMSGFKLAMSFDVTGNNIVAAGFANGSCTPPSPAPTASSSFAFGGLATGTIAADGSFSVQSPGNPSTVALSIQGKIPLANEDQFSGSYTASFSSPIGSPCTASYSGTFTATSFPLVSGVYTGTGSTQTITNGVSATTPITMQVTLQQGGMATNPATGISTPSSLLLTGSIRVQGSSCFTSGVTSDIPSSSVEGNQVVAEFTMDDGSTLVILGTLTDASETRIATNAAIVTGGRCGGTVPSVYQLPELDRQS